MAKQEQKYKYIKTLVWNSAESPGIALAVGNNHFDHQFNLRGIISMPFYIVGVNYEPLVFHTDMGEFTKVWNFHDPEMVTSLEIAHQSSNTIIGDNIDFIISLYTWRRFKTKFQPGVLYDFTKFPIVMQKSIFRVILDVYIHSTFTPTDQILFSPNITIIIGTN